MDALPELRADLQLLDAPASPDGERRWLLHDPVAGRFHRLGARAVALLSGAATPEPGESEELGQFLARAKLTRTPLPPETLAREDAAARPSLGQLLVHKYLFFRIPLVRPQRLLEAIAPLFDFVFTRGFWTLTALAGAFGLILAARQWDAFAAAFVGFLTLEGMVGYAITLVVLKCLHELGHGIAATRYGVRVPVMGVAFLVMFPVLYTDTTEAWAVRSRRKRVIIDAAGMMTEIAIACFAVLAWSFLPDGHARQVAFFLATTSWTMSLLVNLNPCMRFDGYYLIGDALGIANLQATGFGLGRWRMRETLFGWGDPKPPLGDAEGAGLERLLLTYAYGTWVYRFFLFVGIAILVHHIFPKAIGIILFCVEIGMFIALPVLREVKVWSARRAEILRTRRGRATLALTGLVLIGLFAPLSGRVSAPALVSPARVQDVFAPAPALIETLHVQHGERVARGDVLAVLTSAELAQDIRTAELELASARAELARAEATPDYRAETGVLASAVERAKETLAGRKELVAQLTIVAPFDGIIEMPGTHLHPGRAVSMQDTLMSLRSTHVEITAMVPETQSARLRVAAKARIITGDGAVRGRLEAIAPVTQARLQEPAFATAYGGSVHADEHDGDLVPRSPVIAATLSATGIDASRAARVKVFINAERESFARHIWRRVSAVLIRETDF